MDIFYYNRKSAFSLIEALLLVAFFAILLPSLMSILSSSKLISDNIGLSPSVYNISKNLEMEDANKFNLNINNEDKTLYIYNKKNKAIICKKDIETSLYDFLIYEDSNMSNILNTKPIGYKGLIICDIKEIKINKIYQLNLKSYKFSFANIFKTKSYNYGGSI